MTTKKNAIALQVRSAATGAIPYRVKKNAHGAAIRATITEVSEATSRALRTDATAPAGSEKTK
jgi:hypothetical protein